MIAKGLDGKNSRVNMAAIEKYRQHQHAENGYYTDTAYALKANLTAEFPPERINGIVNLLLMIRPKATEIEVENALVR